MTKMATLTTGERVPEATARKVIMNLELMAQTYGPMPLYEIMELCKDPDHKPLGITGYYMQRFGLLVEWDPDTKHAVIDRATQAVVLAAVQGGDPIAGLSVKWDIISVED